MAEGFGASADRRDAPAKSGVAVSRDSLRPLELLKDLGSKVSEELIVLMPNLLTTLRHQDLFVVKQSISSGTALFGAVLEETALQLHGSGKIEQWLEELWSWMVKFMQSVSAILMEPGSIGIKVPALKFIETCILYFTPAEDSGVFSTQGEFMRFNVSHLSINNSILNPATLEIEADRALNFLLDVLQSANTFCGSFVIAGINILATIVKRRPLRYKVILSALIAFDPNFESQKGGHASSIRYSLRTAFVGFLRCNHPLFTESREKIFKALRAIIPGESIDEIVRQVERMARTMDRVSHEIRSNKEEPPAIQELQMGNQIRNKIPRLPSAALSEELPAKRIGFEVPLNMAHSTQMTSDLPDDNDDGNGDFSSNTSLVDGDLLAAEKMIAMIGALLAEGERGAESLELLISNIHADLMADIVIETMKHLPKNLMAVSVWHNNAPLNDETPSSSISPQVVPIAASVSAPTLSLPAELASTSVGANRVGIQS